MSGYCSCRRMLVISRRSIAAVYRQVCLHSVPLWENGGYSDQVGFCRGFATCTDVTLSELVIRYGQVILHVSQAKMHKCNNSSDKQLSLQVRLKRSR